MVNRAFGTGPSLKPLPGWLLSWSQPCTEGVFFSHTEGLAMMFSKHVELQKKITAIIALVEEGEKSKEVIILLMELKHSLLNAYSEEK